ncbi:MAG: bifunctional phosphopantothenoylcysteine decarboxylase/phosphopantothenate--cysteine ligase CoaBC [Candidatus Cloacimonadota bacterium]|nr:MAG: bifunctional phosphopantothenoylcysteine decarboxylase/phosphopantothenate--cysteine ligase CoaBC [Candidatus Cloacimonadota bacterium]
MKTVILGVTASIAAYKSLELTRKLVKRNIKVIPVLTPEAKHLVPPLSLESLSSHKTFCDFFSQNESIIHISIMNETDIIVVVPSTANFIGKLANGIVDNLLLGIVFASDKPVLIAPAMNKRMWNNPILSLNVKKLKKLGFYFVGPARGALACKDEGLGRLEDIDVILEEILSLLEDKKDLAEKKLLITLGRTKEYLDPVRFISNDSSGKFGLEIAKVAKRRGAEVSIIAGYTDIKIPSFFNVIRVINTKGMEEKTVKTIKNMDVIIMNAACSDFTPKSVKKDKIKKEKGDITVSLKRTKDILSLIKLKKAKQLVVGFSLDTKDIVNSAKRKMKEKGVDIMIANPANTVGCDSVEMTILTPGGKVNRFQKMSKSDAAEKIIDTIASFFSNRNINR